MKKYIIEIQNDIISIDAEEMKISHNCVKFYKNKEIIYIKELRDIEVIKIMICTEN